MNSIFKVNTYLIQEGWGGDIEKVTIKRMKVTKVTI